MEIDELSEDLIASEGDEEDFAPKKVKKEIEDDSDVPLVILSHLDD
jgi:hypothetical protein